MEIVIILFYPYFGVYPSETAYQMKNKVGWGSIVHQGLISSLNCCLLIAEISCE